MLLSIIIPTFNRLNLLKFTLNSLSPDRHTGVQFEIILIDDGSTDGTWQYVSDNYPGVVLLKNSGKGAGAARNTGLYCAKGKYVMYLDSDDLVGEHYFVRKIAMLEQFPEIQAAYGSYDYFTSDGDFNPADITFKHKYPLITSSFQSKPHLINYLSGNFLPLHSIIWRRDILLKCKGHDITLSINQDVDLFFRAIFNGATIQAVDDHTSVYVRHHSLDTRVGDATNDVQKWIQILDLREKIVQQLKDLGWNDPEYFSAVSKYIFGYWKKLRHAHPSVADKYLAFSKRVFWPVEMNGGWGYRLLAGLLGPVYIVKLKYFLLKRD